MDHLNSFTFIPRGNLGVQRYCRHSFTKVSLASYGVTLVHFVQHHRSKQFSSHTYKQGRGMALSHLISA